MGWYEAIKDGIAVAQKVDNIPLVSELIDAQKQILDLIQENQVLKEKNRDLLKKQDIINKRRESTTNILFKLLGYQTTISTISNR